jgi:hypothetical protein
MRISPADQWKIIYYEDITSIHTWGFPFKWDILKKCLFIDVFNRTSYVYLFFNGKSYENPMKILWNAMFQWEILWKSYVSMENPMKILWNPIFQWKPGAIGATGAMGAMVSAASRVLVWWTSRAGDAPWAAEEGEPPGHAGHHGLQGKCEEKSLRWWDWLIFMVIYDDLWHKHD